MPPTRRGRSSDETAASGSTDFTQQTVSTARSSPPADDGQLGLEPPSEWEARKCYSYLPSGPRLVGRTPGRQVWEPGMPGNLVLPRSEEISAVGKHDIVSVWEERILPQVQDIVKDFPWTSIDVVRIGLRSEKRSEKPVVVWIGVSTHIIPWEQTAKVLQKCQALLREHKLGDVEVEVRVANVVSTAGPALFPAGVDIDDIADVYCQAYSTALGQSFASAKTPYVRGTLGLYLCARRAQKPDLFALTCRHVALHVPDNPSNRPYRRRFSSQPQNNMVIPADEDIETWTADITDVVKTRHQKVKDALRVAPGTVLRREILLQYAMELDRAVASLRPIENRVVGEVFFSPPIGSVLDGSSRFTRDWCLVRLDQNKFPGDCMPKNVVDLRTATWTKAKLTELLNPHPRSPHKFTYPDGGLLPLSGVVPVKELCNPNMVDANGEECMLVGKRGATTGLTLGTANEIVSIVRRIAGLESFISREWLVTSYTKGAVFSASGDSGSVVFDIYGRVCGLLTGGSRMSHSIDDVTYVTPMALLLKDVQNCMGFDVKMV